MASSRQHLLGGPAAKVKKPPMVSRSWSSIDTKPAIQYCEVRHEHVFSIGGFSDKMKMESGKMIKSDMFTIPIPNHGHADGMAYVDLSQWS